MRKIVRKLIHHVNLPCNEATFLIEKNLHNQITFRERIQLKVHLFICKVCKMYNKKAIALHCSLQKINLKKENFSSAQTSEIEGFKEKLKEKIQKRS